MRLEEYINKNRPEFDTEEPESGHFERFEQRLHASTLKKKYRIHWYAWAAAAAIILILGTTFLLSDRQNHPAECRLSGEMLEVKNYYDSQVDQEIASIESLLRDEDPAVKKEVMNDIRNMKTDLNVFPDELCRGMNNEKDIAAMVERYKIKIKTLQSMASFFEKNNKRNTNNKIKSSIHENTI